MTIRTVTVSGVTTIDFNPDSTDKYFYISEKYCWVKNKSEAAMYVSLKSACAAGADGTAMIGAGEAGMVVLTPANKIYISGSGSAEIRTNDTPVCPFAADGAGFGNNMNIAYQVTQAEINASINRIWEE